MKGIEWFILLLSMITSIRGNPGSFGGRAYVRYSHCRPNDTNDNSQIRSLTDLIIPFSEFSKPLGYLGTIGILAADYPTTGPVHYAAKSALRVGADSIKVFCATTEAPNILSKFPDIDMYPLLDINLNDLYTRIQMNDVLILGPGLQHTAHYFNVMKAILLTAKTNKKPVVLDVDSYFLNQDLLNHIANYPAPGLILTLNAEEFETFYPLIKAQDAFSDAHVSIDWKKLGPNVLLYRKGCTDSAISSNPKVAWSLSGSGFRRRTPGQGSAITGAIAVYFNWALKNLSVNVTTTYGSLTAASVATFSAATLMRECNIRAYRLMGRSTLTSDMIEHIYQFLYTDSS